MTPRFLCGASIEQYFLQFYNLHFIWLYSESTNGYKSNSIYTHSQSNIKDQFHLDLFVCFCFCFSEHLLVSLQLQGLFREIHFFKICRITAHQTDDMIWHNSPRNLRCTSNVFVGGNRCASTAVKSSCVLFISIFEIICEYKI